MPTRAQKIIATCNRVFGTNARTDCKGFLRGVAASYFNSAQFPSMPADNIIHNDLVPAKGWTSLNKAHADAIQKAKDGNFVVAAMTAAELGDGNGHLAVVIGVDGQMSGQVRVPMCYAGSIGNAAVANKRVSETFGPAHAQQGRIAYFVKTPETEPAAAPAMEVMVRRMSAAKEKPTSKKKRRSVKKPTTKPRRATRKKAAHRSNRRP